MGGCARRSLEQYRVDVPSYCHPGRQSKCGHALLLKLPCLIVARCNSELLSVPHKRPSSASLLTPRPHFSEPKSFKSTGYLSRSCSMPLVKVVLWWLWRCRSAFVEETLHTRISELKGKGPLQSSVSIHMCSSIAAARAFMGPSYAHPSCRSHITQMDHGLPSEPKLLHALSKYFRIAISPKATQLHSVIVSKLVSLV